MMSSAKWWIRVIGVVTCLARCSRAAATAISVAPSLDWYGSDGSWSAVSIRVGSPPQWIDVMVSTVSSETWVVGTQGCSDSTCVSTRGGTFNVSKTTTWNGLGSFEFGVDAQLGNTGQGYYGLDNITLGSTGTSIPSSIIGVFNGTGAISTTQYMLGFFGLGITPGDFHGASPLSPISRLAEKEGSIPSHSYGYTAGAKYQQKGVPNSLTLGGYDSTRFVPHNVTFNLNPARLPQTYLTALSVVSNNISSPVQLLSRADRVSAIIDSSTPYLWFPKAVCDRFAQTLGLTYDTALNLYVFDANSTQHDALSKSDMNFTFTLADVASTPATLNITLPYAAFDLQLSYPAIPGTKFGDANSTRYYFPLRQATTDAQITIGRVFLQEAYLITDYERNIFSVHQAIHTTDPVNGAVIVPIERPTDTNLSSPSKSHSKPILSTGAIVGIVVAAVLLVAISIFIILWTCRRQQKRDNSSQNEKPIENTPRSLLSRLLHRNNSPPVHEASGSSSYPTEVGADATHERFELAAPLGPAELDSESGTSYDGTTENGDGTQDSMNLSAYERARRKMERQLLAAAAAQAQSADPYPVEKSERDISSMPHYREAEIPDRDRDTESPLVSPVGHGPESGGSLTISEATSPVSPGFVSPPISPIGPPPTYQRFNLSPSNVVYAGRLPSSIRLPAIVPHFIGPDGQTVPQTPSEGSHPSADPGVGTNSSLGSQYTDIEDLYGSGNTNIVSPNASSASGSRGVNTDPVSSLGRSEGERTQLSDQDQGGMNESNSVQRRNTLSSRRRLDGEDFIHIPQVPENRFSWEEERI